MARPAVGTPLDVRVLDSDLSVGEALAAFDDAYPDAGGTATFLGKVRGEGDVETLELTHYEPMTLPGMQEMAVDARSRFELDGLLVWHRVGSMMPGQPIVLVAAAARHRRNAFEAVDYCMDHLKSAAWFWKREKRGDTWRWVEPRDRDHSDLARWR